MKITIKDIVKDLNERNIAHKSFVETVDIYQDENRQVYEKLFDELELYPVFDMMYMNDAPFGMTGINDFNWKQPGVARVISRAFTFHPRKFTNYRDKSTYLATYMLPKQLEWCEENNIHTAFVSMIKRRRLQFVQNIIYKDYGFEFMPHQYNVCPQKECLITDESCWQTISVKYLTDDRSFVLPHR